MVRRALIRVASMAGCQPFAAGAAGRSTASRLADGVKKGNQRMKNREIFAMDPPRRAGLLRPVRNSGLDGARIADGPAPRSLLPLAKRCGSPTDTRQHKRVFSLGGASGSAGHQSVLCNCCNPSSTTDGCASSCTWSCSDARAALPCSLHRAMAAAASRGLA